MGTYVSINNLISNSSLSMKKKLVENKSDQFIIVNELAQVFCGLKGGHPNFTDDWNIAKPLNNENQFKAVQKGTWFQLEMMPL